MKVKILFALGIAVCLAVALYCGGQLYGLHSQYRSNQQVFDELTQRFQIPEAPGEEYQEGVQQTAEEDVFTQALTEMQGTYPDLAGWIQIADTRVNYPVMQTPDNPNYYLHRSLDGAYSAYGVPYVQENCDLDHSDNLIIYGHHMKNGDVFGSLSKYNREAYWQEHPIIFLWTLEGPREYEIFAVFKVNVDPSAGNVFAYNEFVDAESAEEFDSFVSQVKKRAFYDTGITPVYGEQMLMLSTCEYTYEDGRLVIAARRIN